MDWTSKWWQQPLNQVCGPSKCRVLCDLWVWPTLSEKCVRRAFFSIFQANLVSSKWDFFMVTELLRNKQNQWEAQNRIKWMENGPRRNEPANRKATGVLPRMPSPVALQDAAERLSTNIGSWQLAARCCSGVSGASVGSLLVGKGVTLGNKGAEKVEKALNLT